MAIPSPSGGMQRSAWKDPTVQDEIHAWSSRLTWLGFSADPVEFEDQLWDFATAYMDARNKIIRPAFAYARWCGTWQPWQMFVAPHRYPSRLHVDVLIDETWQPIYIARSSNHDWQRPLLDHERVRSMLFRYAWRHHRRNHRKFCKWLAVSAAEDFPDATQIRMRWHQTQTPTPEEVRSGSISEGSFSTPIVFDLKVFR